MLRAAVLVLALVAHAVGLTPPEASRGTVCRIVKTELKTELEPVARAPNTCTGTTCSDRSTCTEHVVPLTVLPTRQIGQALCFLGVSSTVTQQIRSDAVGAACLERVLAQDQVLHLEREREPEPVSLSLALALTLTLTLTLTPAPAPAPARPLPSPSPAPSPRTPALPPTRTAAATTSFRRSGCRLSSRRLPRQPWPQPRPHRHRNRCCRRPPRRRAPTSPATACSRVAQPARRSAPLFSSQTCATARTTTTWAPTGPPQRPASRAAAT